GVCLISGPRIFLARLMVNIIRSSNIIHHHLFPTLKRKYLCVFQQPARAPTHFTIDKKRSRVVERGQHH
ncbi:MAG: hypothetical protein ACHQQQ_10725, partial [Bacteroidota bacterium]